MAYLLYVLKSQNFQKSYVGITDDLERRLSEHNSGKSFYTKRYGPWRVIYTEQCTDVRNARVREKYFKSASGRKALRKIFENL
ncbi:MAG: GIY-YIG nuclease family protein [bacterium]|nr:GIY-YIG nuclease family protein [bacterium]